MARLRDPGLPTALRGLLRIGHKSIESLRARAMARQLREGSHDRVWRLEPEIRRGRVAWIVVVSTAVTLSALFAYLRAMANSIGPGPEADELREHAWRLPLMGTISVGFTGLFLVHVRAVTRLGNWRNREILGVRTTSDGIRYVADDGTDVAHAWAAAFDSKSSFVRHPRGYVVIDSIGPRSDWRALLNAARQVLGQRQKDRPSRRQARMNTIGAIAGSAVMVALALSAALCDDPESRPRSKTGFIVTMTTLTALNCAVFWFATIWDSGLQRVLRVVGLVRKRRVRA
ncbi:MAG: hypothetical protein IT450_21530 [Phycisphaerales bacterium]|nr:hypothetical protein [Phycisphaerales bacterium]